MNNIVKNLTTLALMLGTCYAADPVGNSLLNANSPSYPHSSNIIMEEDETSELHFTSGLDYNSDDYDCYSDDDSHLEDYFDPDSENIAGNVGDDIILDIPRTIKKMGYINERLAGPIPSALGRLSNLKKLILSKTQLSGEIPKELELLGKLRTFDVENTLSPIPWNNGRHRIFLAY